MELSGEHQGRRDMGNAQVFHRPFVVLRNVVRKTHVRKDGRNEKERIVRWARRLKAKEDSCCRCEVGQACK